ncbi:MAG: TauD/TfdA family dioxygenase [Alphaproteobacteria bacterium]|nr:TauD/TfdA family dioxygenase [Alphaproteobacteria bacterium]
MKSDQIKQASIEDESRYPMADPARYPTPPAITRALVENGAVRLDWADGGRFTLSGLWTRFNCACPNCRHPQSLERKIDLLALPDEIDVTSAVPGDDGWLTLVWSDGHQGRFAPDWLFAHAPERGAEDLYRQPPPRAWGAEMTGHLPRFDHSAVMTEDRALRDYCIALRDVGAAIVENMPTSPGALTRTAERIGHLRTTHFGTLFDVVSMKNPNSNAYTPIALPLHTDLPDKEHVPGIQFLHCLVNDAEGGDSILADGVHGAALLRQSDPEAFRILTEVTADFRYKSAERDYRTRSHVIHLDREGDVREIRLNNSIFDAQMSAGPQADALIRAYRKLFRIMSDPKNHIRFRLKAGEMMAFDNRRVLHSRTAFDPSTGGRHLQGCYVDMEDVRSRIRVCARNLQN